MRLIMFFEIAHLLHDQAPWYYWSKDNWRGGGLIHLAFCRALAPNKLAPTLTPQNQGPCFTGIETECKPVLLYNKHVLSHFLILVFTIFLFFHFVRTFLLTLNVLLYFFEF